MAEMDLSISQFRCLILLSRGTDEIPIHELADQLQLSVATAGRSIDRLVAQHLITRREDPHDRRVRLISLSDEGKKIISGIDQTRRTVLLAFARSLPPSDRSRLNAALNPIVNSTTAMSRSEEQHA